MGACRKDKASIAGSRGGMTPLWNILDREFLVTYVYLIRCKKGEEKGIYVHTKRTGELHLLSGRANIYWRAYKSFSPFSMIPLGLSEEQVECVRLENLTEYKIVAQEDSLLLNICNYPWSPHEPQETIRYQEHT